jgi:hypothetical protein
VKCPFLGCGAGVGVMQTKPDPLLSLHNLADYNGRASGVTCPASLMKWPLGKAETDALDEQQKTMDSPMSVLYLTQKVMALQQRKTTPDCNCSEPLAGRLTDPAPDSPNWHLGGREDEDIIPESEENSGIVPVGVYGSPIGRGSGMASIIEVQAMLNASTIAGAEALEALSQAKDSVDRARAAIQEVLSTSMSHSLSAALSNYGITLDRIGDAIVTVYEGGQNTERYMQVLNS